MTERRDWDGVPMADGGFGVEEECAKGDDRVGLTSADSRMWSKRTVAIQSSGTNPMRGAKTQTNFLMVPTPPAACATRVLGAVNGVLVRRSVSRMFAKAAFLALLLRPIGTPAQWSAASVGVWVLSSDHDVDCGVARHTVSE